MFLHRTFLVSESSLRWKGEQEREGRCAKEFTYSVTHKPHNSFRKELLCPLYRWGNLLLEVLDNLPKKYDS